jgi:anthranilate phosphoribosyltransferase
LQSPPEKVRKSFRNENIFFVFMPAFNHTHYWRLNSLQQHV